MKFSCSKKCLHDLFQKSAGPLPAQDVETAVSLVLGSLFGAMT